MRISNIHEAKSHLSHLIQLAYEGEEVIICKSGKPLVRLVRYEQGRGKRKPGLWQGQVTISPDFDEALPEIERDFRGEAL